MQNQLLIGPLAHIKHATAMGLEIYVVDWSRPGAKERVRAEEKEFWENEDFRGKFPGP